MILTLRNRLKILVYLGAGAVIAVSMFDQGGEPGLSIKRLTIVELVLFIAIMVFDRYLWRWWGILHILRAGPVIRGTWKGVVKPTDGTTGEIEAYLRVRQTFSGIALRLMTEESVSDSTSAVLKHHPEGLAVAEYSFENIPRDSVRQRSPIHFGAARLQCEGLRPSRIEGSYFTSRQTSGELEFSTVKRKIVHTFLDAKNLHN